jgi:hypothetical protein
MKRFAAAFALVLATATVAHADDATGAYNLIVKPADLNTCSSGFAKNVVIQAVMAQNGDVVDVTFSSEGPFTPADKKMTLKASKAAPMDLRGKSFSAFVTDKAREQYKQNTFQPRLPNGRPTAHWMLSLAKDGKVSGKLYFLLSDAIPDYKRAGNDDNAYESCLVVYDVSGTKS